jgi:hypothetical protein
MATARARLVDVDITRWYHCVSRCVRRAFLLEEGSFDRRLWIENRLNELAQIFAVAVGGFAVMNNHLHVLVRLDPDVGAGWSDEEVIRRWVRLFPPRDAKRQLETVSDQWVQDKLSQSEWVAERRQRLQSLSWFMKCLKEPLARMVNAEENVRGAFFEERFGSVAVLDEEALLAISVYIDLNPVAAGIVRSRRSSSGLSMSSPRAGRQTWRRPRTEVWPVRLPPAGSKSRCGSRRSKIDAGSTPTGKGCFRGSRLATTFF